MLQGPAQINKQNKMQTAVGGGVPITPPPPQKKPVSAPAGSNTPLSHQHVYTTTCTFNALGEIYAYLLYFGAGGMEEQLHGQIAVQNKELLTWTLHDVIWTKNVYNVIDII